MIVVSDTSPLTGLLTIGRSEILARLFGEVVIPEAVREELVQCHAVLPPWLRMERVTNRAEAERLAQSVDKGEAEAIELAKELRAGWLLIDERKGRQLAAKEGVPVIGLLGIVILAKRRGFLESARAIMEQLEGKAGIYISATVKNDGLRTVGE